MNNYEIHYKYNEDDEAPEGYSIFFCSKICVTSQDEIINLAKEQGELDEDDLADLEFIDYAIKLEEK